MSSTNPNSNLRFDNPSSFTIDDNSKLAEEETIEETVTEQETFISMANKLINEWKNSNKETSIFSGRRPRDPSICPGSRHKKLATDRVSIESISETMQRTMEWSPQPNNK